MYLVNFAARKEVLTMSDGDIYVCDDREDHDDGLYKYPEE